MQSLCVNLEGELTHAKFPKKVIVRACNVFISRFWSESQFGVFGNGRSLDFELVLELLFVRGLLLKVWVWSSEFGSWWNWKYS